MNFQDLESYLSGHWLSDLANFSAFVFENLEDVNWAGFYLSDNKSLKLGPFCGKPACLEIPFGRGVCGEAFTRRISLVVDDVDRFPGHIRCDSNSKSEIVVPFLTKNEIVGVFDVDSPTRGRFTEKERVLIEKGVQLLSEKILNYPPGLSL